MFSRQNLPHQPRNAEQIAQIERGGYVLADAAGTPDVILIATGSEVSLATEAKAQLDAAGLKTRVVSMPSTDVFLRRMRPTVNRCCQMPCASAWPWKPA